MTPHYDNRRPLWVDLTILTLAAALFVSMISLGNWQVQRLGWKLDLIEQVEAYASEPAIPAPSDGDARTYMRVQMDGTYQHQNSLRIKAVTDLGPGYWVFTPLVGRARTMWVNRGFVPNGLERSLWSTPQHEQRIEGLVRMSQPEGTALEKNSPADNRWVSADLNEMSRYVGVEASGYFIDAAHSGAIDGWPRGGLTRVEFRNTHLSYALTWYAMAALFFAAMAFVIYDRYRRQYPEK